MATGFTTDGWRLVLQAETSTGRMIVEAGEAIRNGWYGYVPWLASNGMVHTEIKRVAGKLKLDSQVVERGLFDVLRDEEQRIRQQRRTEVACA